MEQRFIDLHTHILPGVDDGARDMDGALALLRQAWESGTAGVVLTPHYRGRYKKNTPQQLRSVFEELRSRAGECLPQMRLYLGHEAGCEQELPDKLLSGRVLTLAGTRYVLLEFDEHCYRSLVLSSVLDLLNSGFVPVIAHVERCAIFRKHRSLAAEVISLGALLQVNAASILGKCGLGIKLYCGSLLRRGQVSFVASDAHDLTARPADLGECYEYVRKRYGTAKARAVFRDNAEKLLSDSL